MAMGSISKGLKLLLLFKGLTAILGALASYDRRCQENLITVAESV